MSLEAYQALLKELGNMLGIPELVPDEEGHCLLEVDGKIAVNIQYDEESEMVVLYSVLGAYPKQAENRVLTALMEANFFWTGTGGATFGLNSAERQVIMTYRELAAPLDVTRFQGLLEGFVNTSEEWIARIPEIAAEQAPDEVDTPSDFTNQAMRV